jgi:hypothetical protein
MRKISAMIAMGVVLAFATSASAGHRTHNQVPPGNSGIDQYTESIPGAGGNHPTSGGHGGGNVGGGGGNPSAVSPSVIRTLSSQGPAGRGAARLATATAPNLRGTGADSIRAAGRNASTGNGGGNGGSERGTSRGNGAGDSAGSGSAAKAIGAELTGSGADTGMGIWLPIILGSTLAAALALTVLRWRRESRRAGTS